MTTKLPMISRFAPIQRFEKQPQKLYYAPEWKINQSNDRGESNYSPLKYFGTTPEKWEYYNKVVWPPGYIVPETGLPKTREVFHCRESIHFYPKRMFPVCLFAKCMNVREAITQLRFTDRKGPLIVAEVLEEAMDRAKNEFKIECPEKMFVAEAFAIQDKIIKGARRHARERWNVIRYRYINLFIRLQEGEAPPYKGREPFPSGWEKMEDYYRYLRERDFKYSI